jgi:hypothetical protein
MITIASPPDSDPYAEHRRRQARRREQDRLPAAPAASHSWLPWRCRNYPATTVDEAAFAGQLARLATDPDGAPEHSRSETTAVLNALRGGLTAGELVDHLPGLSPSRLYAAYRDLEHRRSRSAAAWTAIVETETPDALWQHRVGASELVPVLVDRLVEAVGAGPDVFQSTLARLRQRVAATHGDLLDVEAKLDAGSAHAVELGTRLYNPLGDAVSNRVDHLPLRVGTLTSNQVAALLGERSCPIRP